MAELLPAAAVPQEPGSVHRDLHQVAVAGEMRFALRFSEAREYVAAVAGLVRIPRAPRWLLGLYSADGIATPLVDIEDWALRAHPRRTANGARTVTYNALRFADGKDSWAIRLEQAPTVLDLAGAKREPVTAQPHAGISAAYGGLLAHATELVHVDGGAVLRVDWPRLASHLKQELSGLDIQEKAAT